MALTTVTGSLVSVNAIQGTLIADNAITAVHIATNAVSGTLIADNAVTAVHIAQNSITVTQLADDCVESDKIADGIITTNHLNKAMISSQTEVSAATGDFVLLGDTSDSNNLKKTPVSSIIGLASGTTINNNADNRIITGSGTANTLNGEANLIFDGTSLGIGTNTPTDYNSSDKLALVSSGNTSLAIAAGTSGESSIFMADGTSGTASYMGYLQYHHSDNHLRIGVNAAERLRIAGNNLHLNGGTDARIQLGTGGAGANQVSNNTVHIRGDGADMKLMAASGGIYQFEQNGTERFRIQAGGGISFNGDTAAANALDDYEEGTWTPAFYTYSGVTTSSITITLATYTKIGNIVHIHANLNATLSSLPGQTVTITGLPFAASRK